MEFLKSFQSVPPETRKSLCRAGYDRSSLYLWSYAMSQETRSLCACLQDFRFCATRDGLSRQEIAQELRVLRERGRDFARQELLMHLRESRRLASL